jgi:hypothetical protein
MLGITTTSRSTSLHRRRLGTLHVHGGPASLRCVDRHLDNELLGILRVILPIPEKLQLSYGGHEDGERLGR